MVATIIISGILASILFVVIFAVSKASDESDVCKAEACFGFAFALSLLICLAAIFEYTNPSIKPMDVYKGKTALKYEVIDGVKVDSTVVWKENLNE